jgi:hypothetical protein
VRIDNAPARETKSEAVVSPAIRVQGRKGGRNGRTCAVDKALS